MLLSANLGSQPLTGLSRIGENSGFAIYYELPRVLQDINCCDFVFSKIVFNMKCSRFDFRPHTE